MSALEVDGAGPPAVLERDILPLIFPTAAAESAPALVVVAGQPGAGRSRAVRLAHAEHGPDLAVLSGEELRAFHPSLAEVTQNPSAEAVESLARDTAGWLRDCIRFARENRRSVMLEGSFDNPAAVTGIAERFAAEGFQTQVVAVASSRAESLLSTLSLYLRNVRSNVPAWYVSGEVHDRGFGAVGALVAEVEGAASIDRVTVLSRDGHVRFDVDRAQGADAVIGAGAALVAAQSGPMSRFDATQWLSELHHVTEFAATQRGLPRGVTETLVDLHEISLREVIPQLHVPADGKFATAIEQRTVARLVALRRALPAEPSFDVAGPVVTPSGPEREGISR